jgi:acetylornithine deacetylase
MIDDATRTGQAMTARAGGAIAEADLIAWAQRFVRYPSPQTERFEAEPRVQGFIGECVMPLVRDLGLPARRDRMGNLICELGPEGGDRSLLLMAYAMTHPASSMREPYAGELIPTPEGRAVRGRGVAEQKGSLAAALAATAAARTLPLEGRLTLAVSTAGETGRHDAAAAILEALGCTPKLGIVVIGTTGRASLGNKGRIDVTVEIAGRAAHSSTPWAGVNAIDGARHALDQIARIRFTKGAHAGLGEASLATNFIESFPRATHTIQNRVVITLDRRLLPGQDPDAALEEIRRGLSLPEPWRLEVRMGAFMHPCEIAEDGPLMIAIRRGCRARGLPPPGTFWSHGALDAGYLTQAGCETAMWGPGPQERWHSDEEIVVVRDLVDGAEGYLGLVSAALC